MREGAEVEQVELHQHQHEDDPKDSDEPVEDVAVLVVDTVHVEAHDSHLKRDEENANLARVVDMLLAC